MFQGILRTPWHCSIWMIGLLLPQLYWFRIMFIGALKVIREEKIMNNIDIPNTDPAFSMTSEKYRLLDQKQKTN